MSHCGFRSIVKKTYTFRCRREVVLKSSRGLGTMIKFLVIFSKYGITRHAGICGEAVVNAEEVVLSRLLMFHGDQENGGVLD